MQQFISVSAAVIFSEDIEKVHLLNIFVFVFYDFNAIMLNVISTVTVISVRYDKHINISITQ